MKARAYAPQSVKSVYCEKKGRGESKWVCKVFSKTKSGGGRRRQAAGTGATVQTAYKMALLAYRDRITYPTKRKRRK